MIRQWSIERDAQLCKERYPDMARRLQPYVEAECDRLEYEGSRMYDEYPDSYMLQKIQSRIYAQARQLEQEMSVSDSPELDGELFATGLAAGQRADTEGTYLEELIWILLYHELFSRRCCYHQCKSCHRQSS